MSEEGKSEQTKREEGGPWGQQGEEKKEKKRAPMQLIIHYGQADTDKERLGPVPGLLWPIFCFSIDRSEY